MFIVSVISSATVIVRVWFNPFATVLFSVCSVVECCVLYVLHAVM